MHSEWKRQRDTAPFVLDLNRVTTGAAQAHNAPVGFTHVWQVGTFKLIAPGGAATRLYDGNT